MRVSKGLINYIGFMNINEYGKHLINYKEFNNLLSSYNWLLVKGLKDNWTPMRHIEYIDNIYYHSPNLIKIYTDSDSSSFDTVWTIDVLIKA